MVGRTIAKHYPGVNSVLLSAPCRQLPDDARMLKPVAEIRREKVAAEVAKAGGITKFADRYNRNEDQVRQWVTGKNGKKVANIGANTARKIETMLGKPQYWLDHPGEVPLAVHSENDVIALQIAVRSLVKALSVNIRGAGPDFATFARELAKAHHFSTSQALLANVIAIAEQGQHIAADASLAAQPPGSGLGTKR